MTIFTTNCRFNCWECSQPCKMKELFQLPDEIFYKFVLDNLKARAGMLLTLGYNISDIETQMKTAAVSLKIAREKCLKTL